MGIPSRNWGRALQPLSSVFSLSEGERRERMKRSDETTSVSQTRLRFSDFQSIEIPWDSSTGYESSASDD